MTAQNAPAGTSPAVSTAAPRHPRRPDRGDRGARRTLSAGTGRGSDCR